MRTPEFSGIFDDTEFDQSKDENAQQALRRILFRRELDSLGIEGAAPSSEALRKYVFEDNKPSDFQTAELTKIFTSFRRHKSWDDMLRLVAESSDPDFTGAAIVREFSAVACNMTGQYDRTLQICQKLLDDGLGNGEVYGAMGKAWLQKGDLEKSSHYYEQGFLCDFETYPGINVAYREIERGNTEKARDIAKILQMASLRDGVHDTKDYWVLAVEFEGAAIRGAENAEIDEIYSRIEKLSGDGLEPWMLESSMNAMKRIQNNYIAAGQPSESFAYAIHKLEGGFAKMSFGQAANPAAAVPPGAPDISHALREMSFSYRGLASNFVGQHFVSGNHRFGGQLPDHSLTRTDWQQFQNLLDLPLSVLTNDAAQTKTLGEITDTEEFLRATDAIVRHAFSTDRNDLENITSEGHSRYDESVHALLKLSGINDDSADRKFADSRTNIAVIMGLGLGDCRHHAQAKQLLFDVWQKQQMNDILRDAYQALQRGNEALFAHKIEKFHHLASQELRTFDVVVSAPIKINGLYSPVTDQSGLPVASDEGAMNVVEQHTMTMLLQSGRDHKVESVRFADSFYQNHYPWGDGVISVADISFNHEGALSLPGKTVKVHDPQTGKPVHVPVELTPTCYAGKKDNPTGDEHGKLLLLGLPVDDGFDLAAKLQLSPEQRCARIEGMRRWYVESGEVPEVLQQRFKPTAPGADPANA